ncbi:MAG: hypothetical protein Q7R63_00375 [bacterium]|nr:hypothetical protein [bacterium]
MQTIAARPHASVGNGAEVIDEVEVMSALALNGEPIRIPESASGFSVYEMFSERNSAVALHELPRDFRELFGGLEMSSHPAQIIQQIGIVRAVNTKRLRMEFDGPCHLDCYGLYQLLRIHRLRGDAHGGLSAGNPSLPHSNGFFLLDGKGDEHCVSLRLGSARWYLFMERPHAVTHRFSGHDKLFVPNSALQFRRKFAS